MAGVISEDKFDYKGGENTMKTQAAYSEPVCDRKGRAEMRPSGMKRDQSIPIPLGVVIGMSCEEKHAEPYLSAVRDSEHSAEVTDSEESPFVTRQLT